MAGRIVTRSLLLALAARAAPSCDSCISAVHALEREWDVLEPGLLADLPTQLCASCPMQTSCAALVREGLLAAGRAVNETQPEELCAQLGFCNASGLSDLRPMLRGRLGK